MTRNRASAKKAGTDFETKLADYFAVEVDDRIERRTRNGAKDRGDLSSVRTAHGHRLVVEAKEYGGRLKPAEWVAEAAVEAGNDDAIAGVVVAKRKGTTDAGEQWVLMTVADLVALLTGARPMSREARRWIAEDTRHDRTADAADGADQ